MHRNGLYLIVLFLQNVYVRKFRFKNLFIFVAVPVDHTFFLANFCTASLASSMMATFIPKATSASSSVSYSAQQRSSTTASKLNGSLQQQQQQLTNGSESHLRVATPAKNGSRQDFSSSNVALQQSASPRNNATQNLYDDKYLPALAATVADKDLTNGMYSHELVSAISQITHRRDENSASSKSVTGGKLRGVDPWGGKVVVEDPTMKEERFGRVNSGSGNATRYATSGATSSSVSIVHQDLNLLANDASSDDMSSASEDVGDVVALSASDVGKPLSFARIASLNLEKQQQVRF